MPEVGGDGAAWADVDAFYDFWFAFRSWREFPHPDEEDVEQAESREERRRAPLGRGGAAWFRIYVRVGSNKSWVRGRGQARQSMTFMGLASNHDKEVAATRLWLRTSSARARAGGWSA